MESSARAGVVRMKDRNPASEYGTGTAKTSPRQIPFPIDGFHYRLHFFHQVQLLINKLGRKAPCRHHRAARHAVGRGDGNAKDNRTFEVELGAVTMQATMTPSTAGCCALPFLPKRWLSSGETSDKEDFAAQHCLRRSP